MTIQALPSYALPSVQELPENKADWQIAPEKAVLLIHDMQQYFVDFYGQDNPLITQVIDSIKQLRQSCKQLGIPVVYTAQPQEQSPQDRALLNDIWGPGLTKYQEPNTEKQKIVAPLAPDEQDTVLTKWRYSAFYRSPLKTMMSEWQRDQLIICGIYGHIGVMQTAVDAFMQDIKPFVVADAVGDFSRDDHLMLLNYIARNVGRTVVAKDVNQLVADEPASQQQAIALNKNSLRAQILPLIEDADLLEDDDNLIDYGLDSVSVMQLIEKWRKEGVDIDFVALAKQPTINGFWQTISAATQQV